MSNPMMVSHDTQQQYFYTEVDGQRAVLEYRLDAGAMVITHTGVPEPIGGRGIAAELTRTALEYARAHDLKVVPACAYSQAYLQRHPEYESLRG